jgi:hypothetical protein
MANANLLGILHDWARWMRWDSYGEGYPKSATGFLSGGASASFDDLMGNADQYEMWAFNAAVDDLPHDYRKAVHNQHLQTKYYIPQFGQTLTLAYDALYLACRRKGLNV